MNLLILAHKESDMTIENEGSNESTESTTTTENEEVNSQSTETPEGSNEPSEDTTVNKSSSYRLKYNDSEHDVTAEQALELAQAFADNRSRLEKYDELEKNNQLFESLVENLKSNPLALLDNLGLNTRELAQDYLSQMDEYDALSDNEKERLALKQELEAIKAENQTREEQEQERIQQEENERFETLVQEQEKFVESSVLDALANNPALPDTPETVMRMTELLYTALNEGIDIEPEDLVEHVKNDIQTEMSTIASKMSGEELYNMLGEETCAKLREYDLSRVKTPTQFHTTSTQTKPTTTQTRQGDEGYLTEDQARQFLESRI